MNSRDWPYAVEPMRLKDIPTVSAIEEMVYSRPWPVDAYRYELLDNPRSHYIVARLKKDEPQRRQQGLKAAIRRAISGPDLDPTLLGYGGIWLMMDEAHVSTLAVHADWQGKGIGELLLVSLIEKAMTLSAEFVTLEVRVSNDRAQNLYRKYGFRQVGVRRKYYSDNNEDALIMTTDDIQAPTYQGQYQRLTRELDAKLSAQSAPSSSEVTGDNGA